MPIPGIESAIGSLVLELCWRDTQSKTDGELLNEYLVRRHEASIATLVRRHGPMVRGVCRRILGNVADAEDACQGAIIVLVRKSHALETAGQRRGPVPTCRPEKTVDT